MIQLTNTTDKYNGQIFIPKKYDCLDKPINSRWSEIIYLLENPQFKMIEKVSN